MRAYQNLTLDVSMEDTNKIKLYHGSTVEVKKPMYNFGSDDNDYGRGFYLTEFYDRAESWALAMGDSSGGIINEYTLDISDLTVLNLDDYGVLAWIAEVLSHRDLLTGIGIEFKDEFISKYKVNTDDADVIVGYRADDSYGTVIDEFMNGRLTHDEVKKLFYKGELGVQYFLKSEKAFNRIEFMRSYKADTSKSFNNEQIARAEVNKFIARRGVEIAKRINPGFMTVIDAIADDYKYVKDGDYYEKI